MLNMYFPFFMFIIVHLSLTIFLFSRANAKCARDPGNRLGVIQNFAPSPMNAFQRLATKRVLLISESLCNSQVPCSSHNQYYAL